MTEPIFVERWITFSVIDGRWDFATYGENIRPATGKLFRLRVRVPDELLGGDIEGEVTTANK